MHFFVTKDQAFNVYRTAYSPCGVGSFETARTVVVESLNLKLDKLVSINHLTPRVDDLHNTVVVMAILQRHKGKTVRL